MKTIKRTSQFKRDVKRMQRRGKDLEKLKEVIESLVIGIRTRPPAKPEASSQCTLWYPIEGRTLV
jgi:mRNA-degrading endonuclease YafQ of YafQ-DinJ toxin-antitoxin module